ncbi:hypothetical protein [Duganella violaceipulchra]|uniref:Uncharacterized protein n=1 Tax=Duganella violaceipulchra TaxID=2849652 RepID=A0AA41HI55_9BURK|nr:hypothetical protein [Duganella violaceicalia]MBV6325562.1 hypothetical protein [Duganella violaceicalia]MCP2012711.1 hypothetical protein [Duganella violaceicalia]
MHYMMMPLDEHFDRGFGAVADSFKDAADALHVPGQPTSFLNAHLPVSFLYRHAIELFLKSVIIIFHRKLTLPYGEPPGIAEPQVLVAGKWKPMYNVHAVMPLFAYVRKLFADQADYLRSNTTTDWSLPAELDEWIDDIDATDSSSTFFRYPVTRHGDQDKKKSAIQRDSPDSLISAISANQGPVKMFLFTDQADQIVDTYSFKNGDSVAMIATLRRTAEALSDCHAALVGELTGGR